MDCFSKLNTNDSMLKYIFDPENYDITIPINISILKVIDELKERNYRIYALSNISKETFEYVSKKIDYFNRFDGGIISYKVHLLKPDEKIYRLLLNKYQLNVDETIFLDDNIVNVNKGNFFGYKKLFIYRRY